MLELWNYFIAGFCKVEFLCWHGDPNWLGWVVLAIPPLVLIVAIVSDNK